jgi:hypothetical protein
MEFFSVSVSFQQPILQMKHAHLNKKLKIAELMYLLCYFKRNATKKNEYWATKTAVGRKCRKTVKNYFFDKKSSNNGIF